MGKSSKKRPCPVVGATISSAECGEGRNSRYACPAECPFNPFNPVNYDDLLRIESVCMHKRLKAVVAHSLTDVAVHRRLQAAGKRRTPLAFDLQMHWECFCVADGQGRTWADTWQDEGYPGLNNDQRVVSRAMRCQRLCLIEVHRVLDSQRVEVVDLLEPGQPSLVVFDRRLAASAVRFGAYLMLLFPLLHVWRSMGSGFELPDPDPLGSLGLVRELVHHLGGPTEGPEMRRWLAAHFARFEDALDAVMVTRHRQLIAASDMRTSRAVYELRQPFSVCRELLDRIPEVEPDELSHKERGEGFAEARVWLDPDETESGEGPEAGQTLLGRVLLGQSHWRIETFGAEPMPRLKAGFEAALGDRVRFTGQREDDAGVDLAAGLPAVDETLVPPTLMEHQTRLRTFVKRVPVQAGSGLQGKPGISPMGVFDRQWLDEPVPALDDATPRAAAQDPALRPRLIQLVKSRVRQCDEQNLRTGSTYDVNWMLRELGLDEILFDPPPWRPCPPELRDESESVGGARECRDRASLPPAPPLPARPFTQEEVAASITAASARYTTANTAFTELEAEGCRFLDDLRALTEGLLTPKVFAILVPALVQAWRMFVPVGTRGPELDFDRLVHRIQERTEALKRVIETKAEDDIVGYMRSGPQPSLAYMLGAGLFELMDSLPPQGQPSSTEVAIGACVLQAFIAEVDAACRGS